MSNLCPQDLSARSGGERVLGALHHVGCLGLFGLLCHKFLKARAAAHSAAAAATPPTFAPLVVCGPSGVGKGTLIKMLLAEFGADRVQYSVSHTTRAPREGEVNGKNYNFVTVAEFERLIAAGAMVEHAKVYNNYYGRTLDGILQVVKSGVHLCDCVNSILLRFLAFCLFTSVVQVTFVV